MNNKKACCTCKVVVLSKPTAFLPFSLPPSIYYKFSRECRSGGNKLSNFRSLSFCNRERAKPSSIKITALIFQVKNSTMKLSGLNIFREYAKKLKLNLVLVVVLCAIYARKFYLRSHVNITRQWKSTLTQLFNKNSSHSK